MSETLRDIRLFVAAYEERSFTAAAMREHGTQSGVSQHVRKLEERFGARLFSRDKGRVTPTPAGDAYYSRCVEMLRLHAATSQCMSQFGKGGSGDVSVGLMPTMTRIILAPAMRRFIEAFPNVSVRLVEAFSPTLTQSVLSGELDFAIVPSIPGRPGLKSWPFLTTHETLVSRFAPDRHLRPVRMGALGPLKLVLPGIANTRRRLIETYVASNGVAIERMLEMDSMMGTLDFVRGSDWCTRPARFDAGRCRGARRLQRAAHRRSGAAAGSRGDRAVAQRDLAGGAGLPGAPAGGGGAGQRAMGDALRRRGCGGPPRGRLSAGAGGRQADGALRAKPPNASSRRSRQANTGSSEASSSFGLTQRAHMNMPKTQ